MKHVLVISVNIIRIFPPTTTTPPPSLCLSRRATWFQAPQGASAGGVDALTCWRPVCLLHGPASARRAELLSCDRLDSGGKQMDRSPPQEVTNQVWGAGWVSRLTKSLDEARRCASAHRCCCCCRRSSPDPQAGLLLTSFFLLNHRRLMHNDADTIEIPPLSAHFLHLSTLREKCACLSFAPPVVRMTQFSTARTESSRCGEAEPFIHTRSDGSKHLCRTRGCIHTTPLSSDCASFSDHLPAVALDGPAGLSGWQVRGGGGLRCFSAGPTTRLPHCSSSPPSGKLNTHVCRVLAPGPPHAADKNSLCDWLSVLFPLLIHAWKEQAAPLLYNSAYYGLQWLCQRSLLGNQMARLLLSSQLMLYMWPLESPDTNHTYFYILTRQEQLLSI